ncbi:hypothetical protein E2493_00075 [Sphingomonas parva]|uniref:Uncharacterized protein n=1 Tax=Sphingomonas parva TaxID=2555898 RepID=A0A4Y8ZVU7_9SPHN|nr:hypothetical protein [Sphingomonas parva]TFI60151.1 hypothetical protein E2493_00075 [Sphingomonas parva]
MSSFLFGRQSASSRTNGAAATASSAERAPALPESVRAAIEVQSITASAIFAMLVSKGVLSATEAADYMREIGDALRRDVSGAAGDLAGRTLGAYGEALAAAES